MFHLPNAAAAEKEFLCLSVSPSLCGIMLCGGAERYSDNVKDDAEEEAQDQEISA